MGQAAIRKRLGLPPKEQVRARDLKGLLLPEALVERLRHHHERFQKQSKDTPASLRDFIAGLLAAAVGHLDREEQIEEQRSRLIQPATMMPPSNIADRVLARYREGKVG